MFIFGDVRQDNGLTALHALAPWVEGNFSDDGKKAYMIPKGTVDKGEDMKTAAIREVAEETGIYIGKVKDDPRPESNRQYLFDPYNAKHKEWMGRGEMRHFYLKPDGTPVKILKWMNQEKPLLDHVVPSNRGNPARHIMYGVLVDGIEHLKPHIKHCDNGARGAKAKRKSADVAQEKVEAAELPSFDVMLDMLRTGVWQFGPDSTHGRLFDPVFGVLEQAYLCEKNGQTLLQNLTKELERPWLDRTELLRIVEKAKTDAENIKLGRITITTPAEFDALFQTTILQSILKDHLSRLRKHMEGRGRYWPEKMGDDHALINDKIGLKIDTKQHPLRYYQESADIIPAEEWLRRMVSFAQEHQGGQYHLSTFNRDVVDCAPGKLHASPQTSIADLVFKACWMAETESGHQCQSSYGILQGNIDTLSEDIAAHREKRGDPQGHALRILARRGDALASESART